jgi:hypothetical protein
MDIELGLEDLGALIANVNPAMRGGNPCRTPQFICRVICATLKRLAKTAPDNLFAIHNNYVRLLRVIFVTVFERNGIIP